MDTNTLHILVSVVQVIALTGLIISLVMMRKYLKEITDIVRNSTNVPTQPDPMAKAFDERLGRQLENDPPPSPSGGSYNRSQPPSKGGFLVERGDAMCGHKGSRLIYFVTNSLIRCKLDTTPIAPSYAVSPRRVMPGNIFYSMKAKLLYEAVENPMGGISYKNYEDKEDTDIRQYAQIEPLHRCYDIRMGDDSPIPTIKWRDEEVASVSILDQTRNVNVGDGNVYFISKDEAKPSEILNGTQLYSDRRNCVVTCYMHAHGSAERAEYLDAYNDQSYDYADCKPLHVVKLTMHPPHDVIKEEE